MTMPTTYEGEADGLDVKFVHVALVPRSFHHSLWRAKNNATSKVTRELLMLALQNVQHVLIRATDAIDFTKAV